MHTHTHSRTTTHSHRHRNFYAPAPAGIHSHIYPLCTPSGNRSIASRHHQILPKTGAGSHSHSSPPHLDRWLPTFDLLSTFPAHVGPCLLRAPSKTAPDFVAPFLSIWWVTAPFLCFHTRLARWPSLQIPSLWHLSSCLFPAMGVSRMNQESLDTAPITWHVCGVSGRDVALPRPCCHLQHQLRQASILPCTQTQRPTAFWCAWNRAHVSIPTREEFSWLGHLAEDSAMMPHTCYRVVLVLWKEVRCGCMSRVLGDHRWVRQVRLTPWSPWFL